MNSEGDMDTISLQRSARISNRIRNEIEKEVDCSPTPRKPKRKGTTSTSVQCKRSNKMGRLIGFTSPITTLPDDLVIEILSRLPPKPFFRCRTVCKSWLSLSSDAVGLNEHLRPTLYGIFYNKSSFGTGFVNLSPGADKVEIDKTISALSSYDCLRIIDCCDGLLLVQALNKNSSEIEDLYVYNPATGTLLKIVLSCTTPDDLDWCYQTFSLAFDRRVYSRFHIISFTSWIDDGEMVNSLGIFSFERGRCINRIELACDAMINFNSSGAFVEGSVYRLTMQNKMLSIDLNKCSYEVMPLPGIRKRAFVEIGQSQGLLHCLSLCEKKGLLSIWVLNCFTRQEWTLKHQLSIDKMYLVLHPGCNVYQICRRMQFYGHIAFHPEKDILFTSVGCDDSVSLDLCTGQIKKLGNQGDRLATGCWVYIPCYFV